MTEVVAASSSRGDSSSSSSNKVENASRVVKKLANSVNSAQSLVFHGARIALVGHVTKTLSSIVKAEEEERSALLHLFQQSFLLGGGRVNAAGEEEAAAAAGSTQISGELRISLNKIETDEHEDRYEIVHDESSMHKELYSHFVSRWLQLTEGIRVQHRIARALLEREATMRLVELVAHYETQCKSLTNLMRSASERALAVSNSRATLRQTEAEHRDTILSHELLKFKQLQREAAASSFALRGVQQLYEMEQQELQQAQREAAELKLKEDAALALEEQCGKSIAELEDDEFLKRRRLLQDEAFLFTDLLKAESVKRGLL